MHGIGHNSGHRMGRGWQKHCWMRARQNLIGKRLPVEVVRTRIRRARELGLAYPQYASILLGSGRDVVGFLFTVDGLHLRLRRQLEMPAPVKEKLGALKRCKLMSFAPSGEDPCDFQAELVEISGADFVGVAPEPEHAKDWTAAQQAVYAILKPLKIPSNGVVLVGRTDQDALLATAGRLAKFLPSEQFFEFGEAAK